VRRKRAIKMPSLVAPMSPRQSCVKCWKGEIDTLAAGKPRPGLGEKPPIK